MSLASIVKTLAEAHGEERLRELLPPHESMIWVKFSAASPPTALVVGTANGRDVLAHLGMIGDDPRDLQYCVKSANSGEPPHPIRIDYAIQSSLYAPFRYVADLSRNGKRKFSSVVKWYFLTFGKLAGYSPTDYTTLYKYLQSALRDIDAGQIVEKQNTQKRQSISTRGTPTSPEPEELTNSYSLRSTELSHDKSKSNGQATAIGQPGETALPDDESEDDHRKLREYLDSQKSLYLLQNIPEAEDVEFVDQNHRPAARSKKLFIGHHAKSGHAIFAYLRKSKAHSEVIFYVEDNHQSYPISCEEVTKQRILHPFNKTYPKNPPIEQYDKARLTLLVKWYFIAAGIVKNEVLKETKAYAERLRVALVYIAQRMGAAAVGPPESPTQSSGSADMDESDSTGSRHETSDTQPTLLSTTPSGSPSRPNGDTSLRLSSAQAPPRGTKRSAEDADFDDLARIFAEVQEVTQQINDVDQDLDVHEIKRQSFLEEWEKEQREILKKRDVLDAKRGDVKQRFKRRSLAVARTDD